jgi:hypothetical protein
LPEVVAVPGKRERNLPAFKAYQAPKPPRPHCYLFHPIHPKFFEPADRGIVILNAGTEVIVFLVTLVSVSTLNMAEAPPNLGEHVTAS